MTRSFLNQTFKKTAFILLFLLYQLTGFAQQNILEKVIHVPDFDGNAKELINRIEKADSILFAYSSEVTLSYEVKFQKKVMTLKQFLDLLFQGKTIDYKVIGNKVILYNIKDETKSSGLFSQTVRGIVLDIDSKMPLPGATVVILNSSPLIGTASDENGKFKLENIPIGRIDLQFTLMGYESVTISNIEVNSGKEVVLDVNLKESVVKLYEVVIQSYKKGEATNDMSLLSGRSISVEETKRYTGGMDDPARVASSFAGVACTPTGGSDIIVRGNSPKYLQWRIDGIEITSPYHMDDQNASTAALTALNNSLLATSDFYTGAFSPEYGNVLSSVMDMKLRKGNNEKFEGAFGIGLMGTDITLEGPFKKGYGGSFLVNYRYSTISLLNTIGILNIPGAVNYQDATFKIVLPANKLGTFSMFGLLGKSGFDMQNSTEIPGTSVKNAAISKDYNKDDFLSNFGISHTISLNSNSFIKTSLSYSDNGMNDDMYEGYIIQSYDSQGIQMEDSVTSKVQTFRSRIKNSVYRATVTYNARLDAKNKIQAGSKFMTVTDDYNQDIYNYQEDGLVNVTDFKKSINTLNNFITWRHSFNEQFTMVAGLHNMNVLLNQKSTLEPRLAFNWNINKQNSIHAGYGKHSTMESVHNYYAKVAQPDGSVTEPNLNLDLLKADHYVIGYETHLNDYWMAKLEVYYQHLYNLPVEDNDTSYYATINEGVDYRYVALVNEGVGRNYGVELTLERFFDNNFYLLMNGSLFDSKYKSLEGVWRNTQYNGNYLVNVLFGKEFKGLGKKNNKTLAINSKLFWGGGKKYIPLLRDANGNLAVDQANNKYWDYSKAYENKIDNIFQLNLSVSLKINKKHTTQEIFMDLQNLTNNRARVAEYYDASQPDGVNYERMFQFFPNLMYRVYF